ncbi:MAG: CBS domain-containing protein [Desulfobulbaceae bacterium]|nr:CBS domain-containing protein [Desulfobulbaceae bacterium]
MEVITTHVNADFDGFAAMVAAKKLYPEAELVFSGSQEKNLRDYLAQQFQGLYDFKRYKHIDLGKITKLIVVDVRQISRIGKFSECLNNSGLEIHLYDHHPDSTEDLKGNLEVLGEVGSISTLFVEIFKQRAIKVTPEEATLLALGIYEDTGTFLHANTTGRDMRAAALLLDWGAKLDIVTQFVSQELSASQVELLNRLLQNASTYTIESVKVVVAKLTLPEYVDNFAVIIRRLMVMENLDVVFGLLIMGERVHMIARSRIPEVNVGLIARDFGGGGHASAASATIRDQTIFEAEEKLIHLLHRYIRPKSIAAEIMSAPVITVTPEVTINEANTLLTKYNITVLPVVAGNGVKKEGGAPCLGMISRRVVEKAIFHKLGHLPVGDYMTTEIISLPTTATLADIQEVIIENRQRLIPLVDEQGLRGVITRTDLLNLLVNDPSHLPKNLLHEHENPSITKTRNLVPFMVGVLKKEIVELLRYVGEVAEDLGYSAYVVGGFVRDLLLQVKNLDIDIVIEGDGIAFAGELGKRRKAVVRTHEKFGTATVVLSDTLRLDVATARLEYYEYPAAMPTVQLSSIKLDLYRRDFTINAMAVCLNPGKFGTLLDFFSSQNDLKDRRIRVLHNLSFVEDPTRIFRAVRFEQRLDFAITKHSEKLIKNAVQMNLFNRFSGARFFSELRIILSEDNPLPALRRLGELGLYPYLWPDLRPNLKIDRRVMHVMMQAASAVSWFKLLYLHEKCELWMVYLLAIMSRSKVSILINFCKRFEVPEKARKKMVSQKVDGERIAEEMLRRPNIKPSEVYWLLNELEMEGLLYIITIARKKYIQKAISQYVTGYRHVRPLINGEELMKMGYEPGPKFRVILNHVIEGQLDGRIVDRQAAERFIRERYALPA